jgi:ATP-binding cassette subfamily F protein uup
VLSTLSGGELRRVDLASKLLLHPDVLMLDEPTNHIDTRSVEWIENFLERYEGSSILVTHDRYFLDRAVNRIVELEHTGLYSFPGSYTKFLEYKAVVEESQIRSEDNRQSLLRRELEWMRRGPKARSTKQQARINRFHDVEEQGPPPRHREFEFEIPEPQPLGKTILNANSISFRYGERVLFKDFTMIMQKGMRVGILGPNGAGKTTLLRTLMGQERPCKGQVIIGDSTKFLYVDQSHGDINPDQNILEFVSDGARFWEIAGRRIYIPAYLEKFLFDKNSVLQPIGNLSGGERNRLDLVRKLLRGGNFLVLDEPTNDLDLYTLRVLEETVVNFGGCALVVSHDRYFLNRICTHMLVLEGEGKVATITGNFDDYLLWRERQEQKAPEQPKPVIAPPDPPKEKASKLTYQEKRELETIMERILKEEEAVSALEQAIGAPGFYQQDRVSIQQTLTDLDEARKKVAASYARWEALTAKA